MAKLTINENHFLEADNLELLACPKNQQKFDRNLPDTIIIHYTAGSSGSSSANYLTKDEVKASAHIVIDRSGAMWQLVPFDTQAWHAGESEYDGRKYYNKYSIGIELDNVGVLEKREDMFYSEATRKNYSADDVVYLKHRNETELRYWHTYTEIQMEVCRELCELLTEKYNIRAILGHEEISPGRKIDPGPSFPLDSFREKILQPKEDFQEETKSEESSIFWGEVTASKLNVRKGPSVSFEKLPQQLTKATIIEIIAEQDNWYKINNPVIGWVSGDYVKEVKSS